MSSRAARPLPLWVTLRRLALSKCLPGCPADIRRIGWHVSKVPTGEVTQVFGSTRRRRRTRLRSKACPRNEAQHDVPYFKLKKPVKPPAAEVATDVRTLAIMLDFCRRNDGPIAVTADFAGNPITFCEQSWLLQHGTARLSGIIQVE